MLSIIECLLYRENTTGECSQQALVAGGNERLGGKTGAALGNGEGSALQVDDYCCSSRTGEIID